MTQEKQIKEYGENFDRQPLSDLDLIENPLAMTMFYRYLLSSHWVQNKNVLDVAPGIGYGSCMMKAVGAKHVTGMDLDQSTVDLANERYGGKHINFLQGDMVKKFPFEDNSFDVVTCFEALEHIEPKVAAETLKEMKRVCKPEGYILLSTPRRKTEKWTYVEGTAHIYEYNLAELGALLGSVFAVIRIKGIIEFLIPSHEQNCNLLGGDLETLGRCHVFYVWVRNRK